MLQLFNARTQQLEDVEASVDHQNEIILTFADGGFAKFPAGMTVESFAAAREAYNLSNEGQEPITPESEAAALAERAASLALIGGTPEEITTDVSTEPTV